MTAHFRSLLVLCCICHRVCQAYDRYVRPQVHVGMWSKLVMCLCPAMC